MNARAVLYAAVAAAVVFPITGCGGSGGPTGPTPPGPPASNSPPVIVSITADVDRAELDTHAAITAVVTDAETPVSQLTFDWQAEAGTFEGQGTSVRWRAPRDRATPHDYVITLTVVERYAGGEHRVTATGPKIRVHDSPKEVADLSIAFLTDFSTPAVAPEEAVRHFSDSCRGKAEELGDVQNNRANFEITSYTFGSPAVTINYGGSCNLPHGARPADACVRVPVRWTSTVKATGRTEVTSGTSVLTAVYRETRWWLCDSQFEGSSTTTLRFLQ